MSIASRPVTAKERRAFRNSLIGIVMVLLAAVMLVVGVGPSVLWMAAVTVGTAIIVIDWIGGRRRLHA